MKTRSKSKNSDKRETISRVKMTAMQTNKRSKQKNSRSNKIVAEKSKQRKSNDKNCLRMLTRSMKSKLAVAPELVKKPEPVLKPELMREKKCMSNGKRNKKLAKFSSDYEVFVVGDIVWAKLRGHPHWPAKVKLRIFKLYRKNIQ